MLQLDSWLERGGWALGGGGAGEGEGRVPSLRCHGGTRGPSATISAETGTLPKSLARSYPQLEQNAHEVCPAVCAFPTGVIFMEADYQTDLSLSR